MTEPNTQPILYCSFCGNPHTEVAVLIAGPEVKICDFCVSLCVDIINQHYQEKQAAELSGLQKDVNSPDEPT